MRTGQDRCSFSSSLRSLAHQSTPAQFILHQVDSFISRDLKRQKFLIFFFRDSILETGYISLFFSGLSFTNLSRSLPCQEFFICRIRLSSRCMFSYWALHSFYSDRSFLSIGRYEITFTALISKSSRLIDTPREHDGHQYSSFVKNTRIASACSVPARPHLPPILWRSEVGNRSCSEPMKLLLANGLISHPRSFDFFPFPFPCLGPGWPP